MGWGDTINFVMRYNWWNCFNEGYSPGYRYIYEIGSVCIGVVGGHNKLCDEIEFVKLTKDLTFILKVTPPSRIPCLYSLIIPLLPLSVLPSVQDIFLSNCWWQKSDIWSQASYRYPISWEAFLNPSDFFLFADFVDFYTHWTYMLIFDRNLIFGHKLHIGMPYCGKRFWTCQILTSCLPT